MKPSMLTAAAAMTQVLARHPELVDSPVTWDVDADGTIDVCCTRSVAGGPEYIRALARALRLKVGGTDFRDNAGTPTRVYRAVGRALGAHWQLTAYEDISPATEEVAQP